MYPMYPTIDKKIVDNKIFKQQEIIKKIYYKPNLSNNAK